MSPLNSYFLQGSPSEQRLIQDLINEQLRMYGQDVLYMPRRIIGENTVIKEITASKFDDSFRIEAYLMNYEGFANTGDLLSKFGVRSTDEINLIISKERYDDFISPLLKMWPENERKLAYRPQEGDLIWFPLDESLFEIKYVEGKKPFYQLNNLYVYELRCERFEYEDEIIDVPEVDPTGIEVNESIKDLGNIYTIQMVGSGATTAVATVGFATTNPNSKSVQYIDLIHDGSGYTSAPRVSISTAPVGGMTATAVAIMTSRSVNQKLSIDRILITNPGFGYTEPPIVTISGGGGSGGIATAVINTGVLGIVGLSSGGVGYTTTPQVTIQRTFIPSSSGISSNIRNAQAEAVVNSNGVVVEVRYSNAGAGYTFIPTIEFTNPTATTFGDYDYNEVVTGSRTGTTGYVKSWDYANRILKLSVVDGTFAKGEAIIGIGASYKVSTIQTNEFLDAYAENIEIEMAADNILDFSQKNPFGEY
jgi:Virus neck protein